MSTKGKVHSFSLLGGGAVNTCYKLRWNEEWFVLRFFQRSETLVSIEHRLYQELEGRIPMPKLRFLSEDAAPYPFAIFDFCPSPSIGEASKEEAPILSYDLGQVLAKIHQVHFPEAGFFGVGTRFEAVFPKGSSPYFEYCMEHFHAESKAWERLGEELASLVLRFLESHEALFPKIQEGGSLVHSDFKPVNLLWTKKRGVTVLDWEFAHSGDGLFDFADLLRHTDQFPFCRTSLERGYKEGGGDLPQDWLRRARLLDILNIIQLLNRPQARPNLFAFLKTSLEVTIGKWDEIETLFD